MENDDVQMLSMPYVGNELCFLMVLPKKERSLAEIEKKLDASELSQRMIPRLTRQQVRVHLPKFQFRWGSKSLKPSLQALGLVTPFKANANHFPLLLMKNGRPLSAEELVWIQDVEHQAKIIVDEKGTEAAAATGIIVAEVTSAMRPDPISFIVDRPALFYLMDLKYHSILFLGRLADPTR
jgi:serpin B